MKTIRNVMTLVGLSLAVLALGATGAKAQGLSSTSFGGTFTLPFEAQWGAMTLPAGNYSLSYGQPFPGGTYAVEVVGKTEGSPHGMILVRAGGQVSATKDSLICVREGDSLVVRKLDMPAIGKSVNFALPHGLRLVAHKQRHGMYTLAEAPMLIQRVPVQMNGK
jgi:hypothetical protein